MNREVIVIIGKTGFGKSWWAKCYAQAIKRLLLYDPLVSQEYRVEYIPVQDIYEKVFPTYADSPSEYRFGITNGDDVDVLGNIAYLSGNNLLILEESATIHDKGMRLDDWEKRIIFLGRHRSCSLICLAQRAVYVPIDLRSQANRVVTFSQFEGDDLSWLVGFMGKENVQKLPFLPKFTCLDSHNGHVMEYSIKNQVKNIFGISLESLDLEGIPMI